MMENLERISIESAGGGVVGLGALWLLLKRFAVRAATEDVSLSEARATTSVIELLRGEIERLAAANARLANELTIFQIENAKLNRKISELSEALDEMKVKLEIVAIRERKTYRVNNEERRDQGNRL